LLIVVAIFWTLSEGDAQQQVGYVLDARGVWFVKGNTSQKLFKGSALPAGGEIRTTAPLERGSYIIIADRNGNIIESRYCSNPGECGRAIRLPKSGSKETPLTSRVVGAVMALVSAEPGKYASFISRGSALEEAVVKLSDEQVDLAPVFKNMPVGRYLLRLEQVSSKDRQRVATPVKPVEFDWDPNKPSSLPVIGLMPGLYKVMLLEKEGDKYEPTDTDAWVFISGPGEYEQAAASFQNALTVTKQWGTKVRPDTIREFLRASLEHIATQ
jgi:hypothetical protein